MGFTTISTGVLTGGEKPVKTLTAATNTITAADSGKILVIGHTDVDSIDLPAVGDAIGVEFKIVNQVFASSDVAIDFQGVTMIATIFCADDTAANIGVRDTQRYMVYDVTNGATNAGSGGAKQGVKGDWMDLFCDGTYWYATAFSQTTGIWVPDADGSI